MGNKDDREAEFFAQAHNLCQNLALHHHIKGGGWLVHNQDFRREGQGDGDDGALAHTAAQFVWIAAQAVGGNADQLQQFEGALFAGIGSHIGAVRAQDIHDLRAHRHDRVEGVHGALEDDGEVVPANSSQLSRRQL